MTTTPEALLDSNVVVAALAKAHQHYEPSAAIFRNAPPRRFAIAAHSLAEIFATLTRRNVGAQFRWSGEEAWAALQSVAAVTVLTGLTPGQTFDTIRSYAEGGGIGPRLYDRLIGQVAIHYAIPMIVTWNVKHMQGLFPELVVKTPAQFAVKVSD